MKKKVLLLISLSFFISEDNGFCQTNPTNVSILNADDGESSGDKNINQDTKNPYDAVLKGKVFKNTVFSVLDTLKVDGSDNMLGADMMIFGGAGGKGGDGEGDRSLSDLKKAQSIATSVGTMAGVAFQFLKFAVSYGKKLKKLGSVTGAFKAYKAVQRADHAAKIARNAKGVYTLADKVGIFADRLGKLGNIYKYGSKIVTGAKSYNNNKDTDGLGIQNHSNLSAIYREIDYVDQESSIVNQALSSQNNLQYWRQDIGGGILAGNSSDYMVAAASLSPADSIYLSDSGSLSSGASYVLETMKGDTFSNDLEKMKVSPSQVFVGSSRSDSSSGGGGAGGFGVAYSSNNNSVGGLGGGGISDSGFKYTSGSGGNGGRGGGGGGGGSCFFHMLAPWIVQRAGNGGKGGFLTGGGGGGAQGGGTDLVMVDWDEQDGCGGNGANGSELNVQNDLTALRGGGGGGGGMRACCFYENLMVMLINQNIMSGNPIFGGIITAVIQSASWALIAARASILPYDGGSGSGSSGGSYGHSGTYNIPIIGPSPYESNNKEMKISNGLYIKGVVGMVGQDGASGADAGKNAKITGVGGGGGGGGGSRYQDGGNSIQVCTGLGLAGGGGGGGIFGVGGESSLGGEVCNGCGGDGGQLSLPFPYNKNLIYALQGGNGGLGYFGGGGGQGGGWLHIPSSSKLSLGYDASLLDLGGILYLLKSNGTAVQESTLAIVGAAGGSKGANQGGAGGQGGGVVVVAGEMIQNPHFSTVVIFGSSSDALYTKTGPTYTKSNHGGYIDVISGGKLTLCAKSLFAGNINVQSGGALTIDKNVYGTYPGADPTIQLGLKLGLKGYANIYLEGGSIFNYNGTSFPDFVTVVSGSPTINMTGVVSDGVKGIGTLQSATWTTSAAYVDMSKNPSVGTYQTGNYISNNTNITKVDVNGFFVASDGNSSHDMNLLSTQSMTVKSGGIIYLGQELSSKNVTVSDGGIIETPLSEYSKINNSFKTISEGFILQTTGLLNDGSTGVSSTNIPKNSIWNIKGGTLTNPQKATTITKNSTATAPIVQNVNTASTTDAYFKQVNVLDGGYLDSAGMDVSIPFKVLSGGNLIVNSPIIGKNNNVTILSGGNIVSNATNSSDSVFESIRGMTLPTGTTAPFIFSTQNIFDNSADNNLLNKKIFQKVSSNTTTQYNYIWNILNEDQTISGDIANSIMVASKVSVANDTNFKAADVKLNACSEASTDSYNVTMDENSILDINASAKVSGGKISCHNLKTNDTTLGVLGFVNKLSSFSYTTTSVVLDTSSVLGAMDLGTGGTWKVGATIINTPTVKGQTATNLPSGQKVTVLTGAFLFATRNNPLSFTTSEQLKIQGGVYVQPGGFLTLRNTPIKIEKSTDTSVDSRANGTLFVSGSATLNTDAITFDANDTTSNLKVNWFLEGATLATINNFTDDSAGVGSIPRNINWLIMGNAQTGKFLNTGPKKILIKDGKLLSTTAFPLSLRDDQSIIVGSGGSLDISTTNIGDGKVNVFSNGSLILKTTNFNPSGNIKFVNFSKFVLETSASIASGAGSKFTFTAGNTINFPHSNYSDTGLTKGQLPLNFTIETKGVFSDNYDNFSFLDRGNWNIYAQNQTISSLDTNTASQPGISTKIQMKNGGSVIISDSTSLIADQTMKLEDAENKQNATVLKINSGKEFLIDTRSVLDVGSNPSQYIEFDSGSTLYIKSLGMLATSMNDNWNAFVASSNTKESGANLIFDSDAILLTYDVLQDNKDYVGQIKSTWYVGCDYTYKGQVQTATNLNYEKVARVDVTVDSLLASTLNNPFHLYPNQTLTIRQGDPVNRGTNDGFFVVQSGTCIVDKGANIVSSAIDFSVNAGATLSTDYQKFNPIQTVWFNPNSILKTTDVFRQEGSILSNTIWQIGSTKTARKSNEYQTAVNASSVVKQIYVLDSAYLGVSKDTIYKLASGKRLTNNGTIEVLRGGTFAFDGGTFINNGVLKINYGGALSLLTNTMKLSTVLSSVEMDYGSSISVGLPATSQTLGEQFSLSDDIKGVGAIPAGVNLVVNNGIQTLSTLSSNQNVTIQNQGILAVYPDAPLYVSSGQKIILKESNIGSIVQVNLKNPYHFMIASGSTLTLNAGGDIVSDMSNFTCSTTILGTNSAIVIQTDADAINSIPGIDRWKIAARSTYNKSVCPAPMGDVNSIFTGTNTDMDDFGLTDGRFNYGANLQLTTTGRLEDNVYGVKAMPFTTWNIASKNSDYAFGQTISSLPSTNPFSTNVQLNVNVLNGSYLFSFPNRTLNIPDYATLYVQEGGVLEILKGATANVNKLVLASGSRVINNGTLTVQNLQKYTDAIIQGNSITYTSMTESTVSPLSTSNLVGYVISGINTVWNIENTGDSYVPSNVEPNQTENLVLNKTTGPVLNNSTLNIKDGAIVEIGQGNASGYILENADRKTINIFEGATLRLNNGARFKNNENAYVNIFGILDVDKSSYVYNIGDITIKEGGTLRTNNTYFDSNNCDLDWLSGGAILETTNSFELGSLSILPKNITWNISAQQDATGINQLPPQTINILEGYELDVNNLTLNNNQKLSVNHGSVLMVGGTLEVSSGSTLNLDHYSQYSGNMHVLSGGTLQTYKYQLNDVVGGVKNTSPTFYVGSILKTMNPFDISSVTDSSINWNIGSNYQVLEMPNAVKRLTLLSGSTGDVKSSLTVAPDQNLILNAGSLLYNSGVSLTVNGTLDVDVQSKISDFSNVSVFGTLITNNTNFNTSNLVSSMLKSGSKFTVNALFEDTSTGIGAIPTGVSLNIGSTANIPITGEEQTIVNLKSAISVNVLNRAYLLVASSLNNSVTVQNGGTLDVANGALLNKPVVLQAGGILESDAENLSSVPTVTYDEDSVLYTKNTNMGIQSTNNFPSSIWYVGGKSQTLSFWPKYDSQSKNLNHINLMQGSKMTISSSLSVPLGSTLSVGKLSCLDINSSVTVSGTLYADIASTINSTRSLKIDSTGIFKTNAQFVSDLPILKNLNFGENGTFYSTNIFNDSKKDLGDLTIKLWKVGSTVHNMQEYDEPGQTASNLKSSVSIIEVESGAYLFATESHNFVLNSGQTLNNNGTFTAMPFSTFTVQSGSRINNSGTISVMEDGILQTNLSVWKSTDGLDCLRQAWMQPRSIFQTTNNFTDLVNMPSDIIWNISNAEENSPQVLTGLPDKPIQINVMSGANATAPATLYSNQHIMVQSGGNLNLDGMKMNDKSSSVVLLPSGSLTTSFTYSDPSTFSFDWFDQGAILVTKNVFKDDSTGVGSIPNINWTIQSTGQYSTNSFYQTASSMSELVNVTVDKNAYLYATQDYPLMIHSGQRLEIKKDGNLIVLPDANLTLKNGCIITDGTYNSTLKTSAVKVNANATLECDFYNVPSPAIGHWLQAGSFFQTDNVFADTEADLGSISEGVTWNILSSVTNESTSNIYQTAKNSKTNINIYPNAYLYVDATHPLNLNNNRTLTLQPKAKLIVLNGGQFNFDKSTRIINNGKKSSTSLFNILKGGIFSTNYNDISSVKDTDVLFEHGSILRTTDFFVDSSKSLYLLPDHIIWQIGSPYTSSSIKYQTAGYLDTDVDMNVIQGGHLYVDEDRPLSVASGQRLIVDNNGTFEVFSNGVISVDPNAIIINNGTFNVNGTLLTNAVQFKDESSSQNVGIPSSILTNNSNFKTENAFLQTDKINAGFWVIASSKDTADGQYIKSTPLNPNISIYVQSGAILLGNDMKLSSNQKLAVQGTLNLIGSGVHSTNAGTVSIGAGAKLVTDASSFSSYNMNASWLTNTNADTPYPVFNTSSVFSNGASIPDYVTWKISATGQTLPTSLNKIEAEVQDGASLIVGAGNLFNNGQTISVDVGGKLDFRQLSTGFLSFTNGSTLNIKAGSIVLLNSNNRTPINIGSGGVLKTTAGNFKTLPETLSQSISSDMQVDWLKVGSILYTESTFLDVANSNTSDIKGVGSLPSGIIWKIGANQKIENLPSGINLVVESKGKLTMPKTFDFGTRSITVNSNGQVIFLPDTTIQNATASSFSVKSGGTFIANCNALTSFCSNWSSWFQSGSTLQTNRVLADDQDNIGKLNSSVISTWKVSSGQTSEAQGQSLSSLSTSNQPSIILTDKSVIFGKSGTTYSFNNLSIMGQTSLHNPVNGTIVFPPSSQLFVDQNADITNLGTIIFDEGAKLITNSSNINDLPGVTKYYDNYNPFVISQGAIVQTLEVFNDDSNGVGALPQECAWSIAAKNDSSMSKYQTASALPSTVSTINVLPEANLCVDTTHSFTLKNNQILTIEAGEQSTVLNGQQKMGLLDVVSNANFNVLSGARLNVNGDFNVGLGSTVSIAGGAILSIDKDANISGDQINISAGAILETNAEKLTNLPGLKQMMLGANLTLRTTGTFNDFFNLGDAITKWHIASECQADLSNVPAGVTINVVEKGKLTLSNIGSQSLTVNSKGRINADSLSGTHSNVILTSSGILSTNSTTNIDTKGMTINVGASVNTENVYTGSLPSSNFSTWIIGAKNQTTPSNFGNISAVHLASSASLASNFVLPTGKIFITDGSDFSNITGSVSNASAFQTMNVFSDTAAAVGGISKSIPWKIGSTALYSSGVYQTASQRISADVNVLPGNIEVLPGAYLYADSMHGLTLVGGQTLTVDTGATVRAVNGSTFKVDRNSVITNNGVISIDSGAKFETNASDFAQNLQSSWLKSGSTLYTTAAFKDSDQIPAGVVWNVGASQTDTQFQVSSFGGAILNILTNVEVAGNNLTIQSGQILTGDGTLSGVVNIEGLLELKDLQIEDGSSVNIKNGGIVQIENNGITDLTFETGSILQTTRNFSDNFVSGVEWNIAGVQGALPTNYPAPTIVTGGILNNSSITNYTLNGGSVITGETMETDSKTMHENMKGQLESQDEVNIFKTNKIFNDDYYSIGKLPQIIEKWVINNQVTRASAANAKNTSSENSVQTASTLAVLTGLNTVEVTSGSTLCATPNMPLTLSSSQTLNGLGTLYIWENSIVDSKGMIAISNVENYGLLNITATYNTASSLMADSTINGSTATIKNYGVINIQNSSFTDSDKKAILGGTRCTIVNESIINVGKGGVVDLSVWSDDITSNKGHIFVLSGGKLIGSAENSTAPLVEDTNIIMVQSGGIYETSDAQKISDVTFQKDSILITSGELTMIPAHVIWKTSESNMIISQSFDFSDNKIDQPDVSLFLNKAKNNALVENTPTSLNTCSAKEKSEIYVENLYIDNFKIIDSILTLEKDIMITPTGNLTLDLNSVINLTGKIAQNSPQSSSLSTNIVVAGNSKIVGLGDETTISSHSMPSSTISVPFKTLVTTSPPTVILTLNDVTVESSSPNFTQAVTIEDTVAVNYCKSASLNAFGTGILNLSAGSTLNIYFDYSSSIKSSTLANSSLNVLSGTANLNLSWLSQSVTGSTSYTQNKTNVTFASSGKPTLVVPTLNIPSGATLVVDPAHLIIENSKSILDGTLELDDTNVEFKSNDLMVVKGDIINGDRKGSIIQNSEYPLVLQGHVNVDGLNVQSGYVSFAGSQSSNNIKDVLIADGGIIDLNSENGNTIQTLTLEGGSVIVGTENSINNTIQTMRVKEDSTFIIHHNDVKEGSVNLLNLEAIDGDLSQIIVTTDNKFLELADHPLSCNGQNLNLNLRNPEIVGSVDSVNTFDLLFDISDHFSLLSTKSMKTFAPNRSDYMKLSQSFITGYKQGANNRFASIMKEISSNKNVQFINGTDTYKIWMKPFTSQTENGFGHNASKDQLYGLTVGGSFDVDSKLRLSFFTSAGYTNKKKDARELSSNQGKLSTFGMTAHQKVFEQFELKTGVQVMQQKFERTREIRQNELIRYTAVSKNNVLSGVFDEELAFVKKLSKTGMVARFGLGTRFNVSKMNEIQEVGAGDFDHYYPSKTDKTAQIYATASLFTKEFQTEHYFANFDCKYKIAHHIGDLNRKKTIYFDQKKSVVDIDIQEKGRISHAININLSLLNKEKGWKVMADFSGSYQKMQKETKFGLAFEYGL